MKQVYLLPFEELFENRNSDQHKIPFHKLLGLPVPLKEFCIRDNPALSEDEIYEKYRGTWWQIVCTDTNKQLSENKTAKCFYVADSLRDALRCHPDAGCLYFDQNPESLEEYEDEYESQLFNSKLQQCLEAEK